MTFDDKDRSDNNIDLIEWYFPNFVKGRIQTSKGEVFKQVVTGLEPINEHVGTNYKLSKIYFTLFDSEAYSVYSVLIGNLIRHYHNGKECRKLYVLDFRGGF